MFRKLFHRFIGHVCLGNYLDVVAKHIESTDMQFYSSPSDRIAAGSHEIYF